MIMTMSVNRKTKKKRKLWKSEGASGSKAARKRSKADNTTNSKQTLKNSALPRDNRSAKACVNKALIDSENVKSFQPQQLPLPSSRKSQYKIKKKKHTLLEEESNSSPETTSKDIRCDKVKLGCVLHLSHPGRVSLQGRAELTVLCGEISLFGHKMTTESNPVRLFSPTSHSLVTVSPLKEHGQTDLNYVKNLCKKHLLSKDEVMYILTDFNPDSVLLLLKQFDSTCCDFVTKYFSSQSLFSKFSHERFSSPVSDANEVLGLIGVQVDFVEDSNVPVIIIPEDFVTVSDRWLKALDQTDIIPKVLTCGGKNVGKSTFNRYLINSTLQRTRSVCYLDCDVGQTEFNPPGCIALHVINTPVVGPPFTNQQDPYFMCYFGLVSPSENPRQYSSCVQRVYRAYESMGSKPPLIINTMGWNKGLGVNLLVDTCYISQPNLIIQLDSMNQANNFPGITPDFLHNSPGWIYNRNDQPQEEVSPFQHELIITDSPVVPSIESQMRFSARDHRDMSILGYFSPCLKFGQSLQEVQPYCIPWNQLALHTCHLAVPPTEILAAINASIVALCVVDLTQAKSKRDHPDLPLLLDKAPVCQCLGMGIVRGIDMDKQLIYLITPVELSTLRRVNALIRGCVNLPDQVLMKQRSDGSIPYVGPHLSLKGASSVRPRRYMPRKRREINEVGDA